jgi:hypothetical protein
MHETQDERSLGELFADLARESSTLIRQEMDLAKTELSQKAAHVGKDIGFLALGGLILYAGLLVVLAGIVIGLDQAGLPGWVAALLVGLIVLGVGYGLVHKGLTALRREELAPKRSIESFKEDARAVRG